MNRRKTIGFDRRIDLEWLDAVAGKAASGSGNEEIREYIWDFLDGIVSGDVHGSARQKTTTVLHHIWGDVPTEAKALRDRSLVQLQTCTTEERLALHWAMMVATYPLFTDTASAIGRLLMLQEQFTLAHLTRRLISEWGERSTLSRATQRIVRSMVQWGALQDAGSLGEYKSISGRKKLSKPVSIILVEALLLDSEGGSAPLNQLVSHPALFPFALELNAGDFRSAGPFRVYRQGLDVDYLELR